MIGLLALLAFAVTAPAAIIGSDDRPRPRRRSVTCWACCGTARYQSQICRVCRGSGVSHE